MDITRTKGCFKKNIKNTKVFHYDLLVTFIHRFRIPLDSVDPLVFFDVLFTSDS